ncbi:MAG: DMT family transporter [Paracoccaceae bacterium]|nr:DMT family transporter [Paracoccaceae bacterium]
MAISDNARGALYMNIAMLAFTLNDSAMKAVTQTLPLFQAIFLRGILTIVALLAIGYLLGGVRLWPGGRDGRVIMIRSVAEVAATVLFLAALVHMPLANLSAIMQSLPLAVTLVAALVFGDKIGWRRLLAILIGFVGVTIIIRPGTEGFDIWSVMGLGSVACVVVRDLSTRELSRAVPSVSVAIWAALSVTFMGLVGMSGGGWQSVEPREAMLIIGAAANVIVGYMFVIMVMRVGDIGFVAPFRYMALLWAILLGWLMFNTLPDLWTVVGAVIVVATGIFTFYRESLARRAAARVRPAGLGLPEN